MILDFLFLAFDRVSLCWSVVYMVTFYTFVFFLLIMVFLLCRALAFKHCNSEHVTSKSCTDLGFCSFWQISTKNVEFPSRSSLNSVISSSEWRPLDFLQTSTAWVIPCRGIYIVSHPHSFMPLTCIVTSWSMFSSIFVICLFNMKMPHEEGYDYLPFLCLLWSISWVGYTVSLKKCLLNKWKYNQRQRQLSSNTFYT